MLNILILSFWNIVDIISKVVFRRLSAGNEPQNNQLMNYWATIARYTFLNRRWGLLGVAHAYGQYQVDETSSN